MPFSTSADLGQEKGQSEARPADVARAAVAELHDLGAAPDAVRRIVSITSDEGASINDLRRAICREPAVAVRVLKVVNSAFYGMRGHIYSIDLAIKMLGFEAVRQVAVATTILPLFRSNQLHPEFDVHDLGQHSMGVAAASAMLTTASGLSSHEPAFLAGLVHDVGILVEIRMAPKVFGRALADFHDEAGPSSSFRAAERAQLGADHEQFGGALCEHWRFPESICQAARCHHRPEEAGPTLAGVVHLADIVATRAGIGYSGTVETTEAPAELLEGLGLSEGDLDQVREELPDAVQEAEELFA